MGSMGDIKLALVMVLVALVFLDAMTTVSALAAGARERNPILRRLISALGLPGALLLTHSAMTGVIVTVGPRAHPLLLAAIAVVFARAVFVNARNAKLI